MATVMPGEGVEVGAVEMILKWLTKPTPLFYRDHFAWLPVRAFDEYTSGTAIVWLRRIRTHDNGKVTFSSFGL